MSLASVSDDATVSYPRASYMQRDARLRGRAVDTFVGRGVAIEPPERRLQLVDVRAAHAGRIGRNAGTAPSSTMTGRPDTTTTTLPSRSSSPTSTGTPVTVPLSSEDGAVTVADWPGTTLPRSTTLDDRIRSSTGAVISDGSGGAARAAAVSGDWTRDPATQPTTATADDDEQREHRDELATER